MSNKADETLNLVDFMQLAVSLMDSIRMDIADGGQVTEQTEIILSQMEEKYETLDSLMDVNSGETH